MYLSDMHTHSIASGHGTSCTISEMAKIASRKGLEDFWVLRITVRPHWQPELLRTSAV